MDTLMCLVCGSENEITRHFCADCRAELGTTHVEPISTVALEPGEVHDVPPHRPTPA